MKRANNTETGALGEAIALRFLENHGFNYVEQNYREKWGEIDLIVQKDTVIHFVEVKSVSHGTREALLQAETDGYRPEENLTSQKYQRLERAIGTWLRKEDYGGHYQLDLVTVRLAAQEAYAQVEYYPGITVD